MALLEEKIAAELLVLVNAESLPTDPTDPAPDPGHPASANYPESADHPETPEDTRTTKDTQAAGHTEDIQAAGHTGSPRTTRDTEEADAAAGANPGTDADVTAESTVENADQSDANSADPATGPRDVQSSDGVTGRAQATSSQRSESQQRESQGSTSQRQESHLREAWWGEWHSSDPPGDTCAPHTHAGFRPAGEVRHGPGGTKTPSGTSEPEPGAPGARGSEPGSPPGAESGGLSGARLGTVLGPLLGTAPGLLLATGQVLPIAGVHRLARTSTLVRLVMDADGQVLDMGRKVRLATPAQRRAVFARYATCWIDGCPLPATKCQIDHADNWSTGG
ncbi:DUF222 domain-containing protein, partial [Microbispora sp. NPDC049633]|uniref:DUF222 domain-containing protein n=1 Tax=Microbispora sp. NPDC049633 TaxID=3154355 RepID=UPI00341716CD